MPPAPSTQYGHRADLCVLRELFRRSGLAAPESPDLARKAPLLSTEQVAARMASPCAGILRACKAKGEEGAIGQSPEKIKNVLSQSENLCFTIHQGFLHPIGEDSRIRLHDLQRHLKDNISSLIYHKATILHITFP